MELKKIIKKSAIVTVIGLRTSAATDINTLQITWNDIPNDLIQEHICNDFRNKNLLSLRIVNKYSFDIVEKIYHKRIVTNKEFLHPTANDSKHPNCETTLYFLKRELEYTYEAGKDALKQYIKNGYGDKRLAIIRLESAANGGHSGAQYTLGHLLWRDGKFEKAQIYFTRAESLRISNSLESNKSPTLSRASINP